MQNEIRVTPTIKRSVLKLLGKSLGNTVLTLVGITILIIGYIQYASVPKNPYKTLFSKLEQTGQLLYYDGDLTKLQKATVVSIVDGDTIKVSINGEKEESVRYIGVDTPEIKHQGNGSDELYGQEATELNKWLVENSTVYLQADQAETDKYGRALRYVYRNDGVMVNYVLVRLGYAQTLTIPPNVMFQKKFSLGQELAKQDKYNLWDR